MDEIILNVNWVAVIVGAIVSFLLGWVVCRSDDDRDDHRAGHFLTKSKTNVGDACEWSIMAA